MARTTLYFARLSRVARTRRLGGVGDADARRALPFHLEHLDALDKRLV